MAALVAVVVLALATVVAGEASTPTAAATTTSKSPPVIYIFGDSMSDVGNNNYLLLSLAKCDYPWYGIDYKTGYPTGRFTNGRTIGDIMGKLHSSNSHEYNYYFFVCQDDWWQSNFDRVAAKFGSPPPVPFLSLYMTDDEVLGGVNFASGGAGLLNETGIYFVS